MGILWRKGLFILIMIILVSTIALAISTRTPEGVDSTSAVTTSRRTATSGTIVNATAGNITNINLNGKSVTQMWQAYYGNVTGTITLEDSAGWVFYNWSQGNPRGEVYASLNGSLNWLNVECYNLSAAKVFDSGVSGDLPSTNYLNMSELETGFGGTTVDVDGVNETFTEPLNRTFAVANLSITSHNGLGGSQVVSTNGCYQANAFKSNNTQARSAGIDTSKLNFTMTILIQDNQRTDAYNTTCTSNGDTTGCPGINGADNTLFDLVWVAFLEDYQQPGYNGGPSDYQMLVPENGHNGDTATTHYYFYVELD